jgi:uncharacterized membrane protein YgdD (TMEM256/DUF423 family)
VEKTCQTVQTARTNVPLIHATSLLIVANDTPTIRTCNAIATTLFYSEFAVAQYSGSLTVLTFRTAIDLVRLQHRRAIL